MPARDSPAAEVPVDADLVARLVALQRPDLAGRAVGELTSGWDNAIFTLGDDLLVRLPKRAVAVPLVEHEQRWLPELAPRLPLPVPVPVHAGTPAAGFPWPWSICPAFPGTTVLDLVDGGGSLTDPVAEAGRLGAFLAALHVPAPREAPANPVRGIPLAGRAHRLAADLERLADDPALPRAVDADAVRAAFAECLAVPAWDRDPVWVHGDVHPGNLITDGGRISAVIDLGDLCAGDPASDLAGAWLTFDADGRDALRRAAGVDDATWARGRGWGLCIGAALVATSADRPPYRRMGERALVAALDG